MPVPLCDQAHARQVRLVLAILNLECESISGPVPDSQSSFGQYRSVHHDAAIGEQNSLAYWGTVWPEQTDPPGWTILGRSCHAFLPRLVIG
ncbi:hypothetical protein Athai_42930 [Actinocatenispora thailandica]|uniref:Uncharacterized protein n=1 Tax=Actinocatenispora thailandica TaxID=227318 RepID=A0A7R7DRZ3_9ACTN|nr:hypothetical protein Athai_42930 [Actinocatenispora thailandica]